MSEMLFRCDGGANAKHSAAACVGYDMTAGGRPTHPRVSKAVYLGDASSNVAEHVALLLALRTAKQLGATRVVVQSDSRLTVNHFTGHWTASGRQLSSLTEHCRSVARRFRHGVDVVWVPRDEVAEAHHLVQAELADRAGKRPMKRTDAQSRIEADVHDYLQTIGVPPFQQTSLAIFVAGCAFVPLATHTDGTPSVTAERWANIEQLNEVQPAIVLWRPYGAKPSPIPAEELKAVRTVRGIRNNKRDGGAELMVAYADDLDFREIARPFGAGPRLGEDGTPIGWLFGTWRPAREAAWWMDA